MFAIIILETRLKLSQCDDLFIKENHVTNAIGYYFVLAIVECNGNKQFTIKLLNTILIIFVTRGSGAKLIT